MNEGAQKGSPDRFQMVLNPREPADGVLASKSRAGAPVRYISRNHSHNAVSRVIGTSFRARRVGRHPGCARGARF